MKAPKICAVITRADTAIIGRAETMADMLELRLDMLGRDWPELVSWIHRPWIATNRSAQEGGHRRGSESRRIEELLKAAGAGAAVVDIELATPGLQSIVPVIKKKSRCLISFHDMQGTPPAADLKRIILAQQAAGADICKVATTATCSADNLTVLGLLAEFPGLELVALAMGPEGQASRLLGPLMGGAFTYAAVESGQESAPGQMPLAELYQLYRMVARC